MLNNYSVKSRLAVLAAVPLVVLLFVTFVALQEMQLLNRGIGSLYLDRVQPLQQIKQVYDAYAVTSVDTLHKYRAGIFDKSTTLASLQQAEGLAQNAWQAYKQTELTSEEARLLTDAEQKMQPFISALSGYVRQINDDSLLTLPAAQFNQQLYQLADPLSAALDKLIVLQLQEADKFRQVSAREYASFQFLFGIVLVVVFLCLAALGWFIYRSIQHPLRLLQGCISGVGADLDLRLRAQVQGRDEIAATSLAFNETLQRLQQFHRLAAVGDNHHFLHGGNRHC